MAKTIRLKHRVLEADSFLYFYDGEAPVVAGVVELSNEVWARNAWIRGFRINADTGEEILPEFIINFFAEEVATVAESDEENDADEGADAGRQPAVEDGVREGEQPRAEGLLGRLVRRGGGDRPADGEQVSND